MPWTDDGIAVRLSNVDAAVSSALSLLAVCVLLSPMDDRDEERSALPVQDLPTHRTGRMACGLVARRVVPRQRAFRRLRYRPDVWTHVGRVLLHFGS